MVLVCCPAAVSRLKYVSHHAEIWTNHPPISIGKDSFAINLQAVCDYSYRVLYVSVFAAGSTHDSIAYAVSSLSKLLSHTNDGLVEGYWVAADDAYRTSDNLLTPWPGEKISKEKDCYNY